MKQLIKKIIHKIGLYPYLQEKISNKRNKKYLDELLKQESNPNEDIIVINMNADDICNSHCVMCNIWKQEKKYEITPEDVEKILKDPFFKDIQSIGVTGGEPTLREDLPQIFEAIFKALPDIKGASTITNCIEADTVIERIEKVIEVCDKYKKPFSVMVSLDGVGKVHERVRGTKGNFDSAMKVYNHFKSRNIEIVTGSTISKVNVWDVDELLDFLKENSIYGRFRIAEFIKRLYNDENRTIIRNFDKDETYHLILFFYKLIYTFEKAPIFIRTYKSIISILSGGNRLIGCPYQRNGVVLNSRGEMAYCAPKSAIIGNLLNESGTDIYQENLDERKRIYEHDCAHCIHDYHAPITYNEKVAELEDEYWKRNILIDNFKNVNKFKSVEPIVSDNKQILITGWYGTETVGDKAILAQIINELYETHGEDITIFVSAIIPLITKRTIEELNRTEIKVIPAYSEEFIAVAKGSDIVIMGGGPLMELEELALPLISFSIAKSNRKSTIIYGCGLGPFKHEKYINVTKRILELADTVYLRDKESVNLAKEWTGNTKQIELTGDPARKYIKTLGDIYNNPDNKKNVLSCYLREWTFEYAKDKTYDEYLKDREKFEYGLARYIKNKAKELNVDEIYFDHMHNFVLGNDDRDFSRRFIKTYFSGFEIPVTYNKKLSTVESIVQSMTASKYNICMRFHSVLFAETLQTSFTAIDYTMGGKIKNYLKDNQSLDKLITFETLADEGKACQL